MQLLNFHIIIIIIDINEKLLKSRAVVTFFPQIFCSEQQQVRAAVK